MNSHKNVRLTFARRLEMVKDMSEQHSTPARAAMNAGVSEPTARKWLGRYLAQGIAGLAGASSRPHLSPRAVPERLALAKVSHQA